MSDNAIKSIIILGGGTAGWMTAAAFGRFLGRSVAIKLIESADIGIVGVGEATVPSIRQFNTMLGIPEGNFLQACKATFKLGIRFDNWRRQGHSYVHPFGTYGLESDLGQFHQGLFRLLEAGVIADGDDPLAAYSLCAAAAVAGKVTTPHPDPASIYSHLHSAYHFDASLYAGFMRAYAEPLGVERVEGEVVDVVRDAQTGYVKSLTLKSGESHEADFFIDCTGFRGLLISDACGVAYRDWSHWLPMNRAWAMPCEHTHDDRGMTSLRPYTLSTATRGGWMWRIPLQHRIGNGHVFSTEHMSESEAADILTQSVPGKALADPRLIKFTAGRRERFWDKNVAAVGLSSGFIEPLESTSISLIQSAVNKLLSHMPDRRFSPVNRDAFNRRMIDEYEHVRDVIIMHYHLTERDDSSLWNYVRTMPIPDSLKERIDLFRDRAMITSRSEEMFSPTSWLAIMTGQGVRPQSYSPLVNGQDIAGLSDIYNKIRETIAASVAPLPSQEALLRHHKLIA